MHTKEENIFFKRANNTPNSRLRHVYVEIQDGRYFCKIVYVFTDPQVYRSFESIKNLQRFDFVKIFVIPGGNAPPKKSNGRTFLPLFQIEKKKNKNAVYLIIITDLEATLRRNTSR